MLKTLITFWFGLKHLFRSQMEMVQKKTVLITTKTKYAIKIMH